MNQKINWSIILSITAVVFVLLIAAGCAVILQKQVNLNKQSQSNPISSIDTTNWETYRNEEYAFQYGFEFKYPVELFTEVCNPTLCGLQSKDFKVIHSTPPGQDDGPGGPEVIVEGFAINVMEQDYDTRSFTTWIKERLNIFGSTQSMVSEYTVITLNNDRGDQEVLFYNERTKKEVIFIFMATPQNRIQYNPLFDEILSTFKFIAPSSAVDTSTDSTILTAGWQTYRNEQYGFEVGYPPELAVSVSMDEALGRHDARNVFVKEFTLPREEGDFPRMYSLRIEQTESKDIEDWFKNYLGKSLCTAVSTKNISIHDTTVKELRLNDDCPHGDTFIGMLHGGYSYLFIYHGELFYGQQGEVQNLIGSRVDTEAIAKIAKYKDYNRNILLQILSTFKFIEPGAISLNTEVEICKKYWETVLVLPPRQLPQKPIHTVITAGYDRRNINVKFLDELTIDVGENDYPLDDQGRIRASTDAQATFEAIGKAGGSWRRQAGEDTEYLESLDRMRCIAEQNLQRWLPNSKNYFTLSVPQGIDVEQWIDRLNSLSMVELAEPFPLPTPLL